MSALANKADRPSLTAAIITLNEAARLPKLFQALAWVDEIVLVDGESTDETVALARAQGCRVVVHPFDHFAAQRNRALDLATSDWVFFIDADETPSAALVSEIGSAIRRAHVSGWHVPIRSRILGHRFRFSGTQDDAPLRLVQRAAGRWQGAVHEVLQVQGPVGRLTARLNHDTIPDLRTFAAKVERYTSLAAEARYQAQQHPRWFDAVVAPLREIFRRLIWKSGLLDGPTGWLFCLLSGWSEWKLVRKQRLLMRGSVG